ncbi:MAG: hypothetical protein Q9201_003311 [Fulgogasparrea decipioides]
MAKGKTQKGAAATEPGPAATSYDPIVSSLFASRPSKPVSKRAVHLSRSNGLNETQHRSRDPTDHSVVPAIDGQGGPLGLSKKDGSDVSTTPPPSIVNVDSAPKRRKKRKRDEDDIEGMYMQRIAEDNFKTARSGEVEGSNKRRKLQDVGDRLAKSAGPDDTASEVSSLDTTERRGSGKPDMDLPQHESLTVSRETAELEKAARTIFLANVSTSTIRSKTARKTLLSHLTSFCFSLPTTDKAHKVESLRFRSTPFASGVGPKKAAYVKKELMDSTTTSTNAYVVYSTQVAAREAVRRLNGTTVLGRHLLADSVNHPRKTDHRRCVFVGNLGFVDDESQMNTAKDGDENRKSKKRKEPSDVEEGLWRQFGKAGSVESVRVVRDATTRVGKGFAYVQFEVISIRNRLLTGGSRRPLQNENGVEKALLYNDKKFPPLLPRVLRVTRARKATKKATKPSLNKSQASNKADGAATNARYAPKVNPTAQSLSGRAGKLFGRAGAAQFKGQARPGGGPGKVVKPPERMVFEGHRASRKQGRGAKGGGSGKKQSKPRTRSSRRGAAFKAKGGKKGQN